MEIPLLACFLAFPFARNFKFHYSKSINSLFMPKGHVTSLDQSGCRKSKKGNSLRLHCQTVFKVNWHFSSMRIPFQRKILYLQLKIMYILFILFHILSIKFNNIISYNIVKRRCLTVKFLIKKV